MPFLLLPQQNSWLKNAAAKILLLQVTLRTSRNAENSYTNAHSNG
jgi:hypothetical protein